MARLTQFVEQALHVLLHDCGAMYQIGSWDYDLDSLCVDAQWRYSRERMRWTLTATEIVNGDAVRWLETVRDDIAAAKAQDRCIRESHDETIMMGDLVRRSDVAAAAQEAEAAYLRHNYYPDDIATLRYRARERYAFCWTDPHGFFGAVPHAHRDEKAEARAKDLFRMVAGPDALKQLERGYLPLKGSAGTEYRLFPRMTYCVERPKDGAKLCAVIEGVPLYDHLLGIKLVIEHDEPEFLRVANVSRGPRCLQSPEI